VGNLWDVTDRDIDRLTEEFLETWLKDHEQDEQVTRQDLENAICMSLNKARNGCKMTFLNGSAPIVYGLPVDLK
jgi:separase